MNQQNDHERLLADVLAGEDVAGFREALFSETLRRARRRRHFRQARRGSAAVAVFVGLGLWVWHSLPSQVKSPAVSRPNYAVVHSQPLPAAALVLTRPLAIDQHVASFTNVQRVQTAPGGGQFREIDDDELLTLAEPKPVALVRRGPHTAELIVLNSTHPGASPPN
jgi:hypothetical protein